jgi:RHS repeat-associated protein
MNSITCYASGNLYQETLPNGAVTTYRYDQENRLASAVTKNTSNNILATYTYTLLSNGLIGRDVERVKQPSGDATLVQTITYGYDAAGHLTSESHDVGSNGTDSNDWKQAYTYDLSGNRLSMVRSSYPISGGAWQITNIATYIYNAENQLTEQDGWALGNIGPDVTTFIYNLDGTLKEQDIDGGTNGNEGDKGDYEGSNAPSTTTYSYDLRGRQIEEYIPASIALGTSAVTTLSAYDTSGNRIMEGSNYFLIDDNNPSGYSQVVEERDGSQTSALSRSYVLGLNTIGQTIGNTATANAVEYILYDGNASNRQLVNTSSAVQSTWSYDAFGYSTGGYNQSIYTGGGGRGGGAPTFAGYASDVGFQGGYLNTDGTVLMGVTGGRNYNPVTGRFLDSDPIGNSFGPGDITNSNLYLFVNSDPVNFDDPTGHFTTLQGTIIHGAIENIYEAEHPLHRILPFGTAMPSSGGLLFPDIMDYTLGEVGEIKPLTPYGMGSGPVQLQAYLDGLNGNTVNWRGKTYTLPATQNDAGKPWTPSTWNVGVQPVLVPLPDQWVFTVGNIGGVIYYTSLPKPQYSLQAAIDAVKNLAQQLDAYSMILSNPNDPAAVPIMQRIEMSLSISIDQHTLTNLAISATAAGMVGLLAVAGMSTLVGALGLI